MPYANNKGADQPAHLRSLISAFVVRCLDSITPSYIQISRQVWAGQFESYLCADSLRLVFSWHVADWLALPAEARFFLIKTLCYVAFYIYA